MCTLGHHMHTSGMQVCLSETNYVVTRRDVPETSARAERTDAAVKAPAAATPAVKAHPLL